MQKSKSKLTYIIAILGVIAIAVMVLKITGVYDITTLFSNSSESKSDTVIDEWVSEPFGDLDVTVSFTSYGDGLIRLKLHSNSEKFNDNYFEWFYADSGPKKDISKTTYDDVSLMNGGSDTETGMIYSAFAVPIDCERILLDGDEIIPHKASMQSTAGKKEFKVCTLTYFDESQSNHQFILIDKGGNEHLIVPFR